MQVITVTCTELGWDCVVGVWEHTEQNLKDLLRKYNDPEHTVYVVQVHTLATKVELEE